MAEPWAWWERVWLAGLLAVNVYLIWPVLPCPHCHRWVAGWSLGPHLRAHVAEETLEAMRCALG